MGILDGIRTLDELKLENQRAFLRLDLDVPVENGAIVRDDRLRSALPTIQHALKLGARVVLAARLGSTKERPASELSLLPVAERLSELLALDVYLPDDCVGDAARKVVSDLRAGQVCLLENLALHEEEAENDEGFARKLARFADVFVNDSLCDSNRAVASLDALPRLIHERGVGSRLAAELNALGRLRDAAERPLVLVLGGDDVASKLAFAQSFLPRIEAALIGGAVANTLLTARGTDLGDSPMDRAELARGRAFLNAARDHKVEVLLPVDLVASENGDQRVVPIASLDKGALALDVGPRTVALFAARAVRAKTLLWNGPLGASKTPAFSQGTLEFARSLQETAPFRVLLGEDTQRALAHADEELRNSVGFVSAGGRASLELIEGRRLPGLEALRGGAT
jgi:phosphoglycerate kinase